MVPNKSHSDGHISGDSLVTWSADGTILPDTDPKKEMVNFFAAVTGGRSLRDHWLGYVIDTVIDRANQ
jgi:hypothetical protein